MTDTTWATGSFFDEFSININIEEREKIVKKRSALLTGTINAIPGIAIVGNSLIYGKGNLAGIGLGITTMLVGASTGTIAGYRSANWFIKHKPKNIGIGFLLGIPIGALAGASCGAITGATLCTIGFYGLGMNEICVNRFQSAGVGALFGVIIGAEIGAIIGAITGGWIVDYLEEK